MSYNFEVHYDEKYQKYELMCSLGGKYSITQNDINSIKKIHEIINKIMEYLIIRTLINRNDVDKIVNQVFKQTGKKFSEFQSNQYAYLRLRSHLEYTECKMISTPEQPKVHSFIVKSNQIIGICN